MVDTISVALIVHLGWWERASLYPFQIYPPELQYLYKRSPMWLKWIMIYCTQNEWNSQHWFNYSYMYVHWCKCSRKNRVSWRMEFNKGTCTLPIEYDNLFWTTHSPAFLTRLTPYYHHRFIKRVFKPSFFFSTCTDKHSRIFTEMFAIKFLLTKKILAVSQCIRDITKLTVAKLWFSYLGACQPAF